MILVLQPFFYTIGVGTTLNMLFQNVYSIAKHVYYKYNSILKL